jgi:hypothetical protein
MARAGSHHGCPAVGTAPDESQAKELFAAYDIPVTPEL